MQPITFPKIQHYRKESDLIHSLKSVVCLEKIDGTNTRIVIPRGAQRPEDISIGGRDLMESDSGFSQPYLLELFRRDAALLKRCLQLSAELNEDITLFGETCGGKIQSMGYLYGAKMHFLLFAARLGDVWLSYRSSPLALDGINRLPSLLQLATKLALQTPPCLYEGAPDVERISALIERPSQHAINQGFARKDVENLQEGVVLWADPLLLDPFGQPLVCKWKHPKRRETIEVEEEVTQSESPSDFAARVILPERLKHAITALQDTGKWSEDNAANKEALVRRVIQDVSKEVPEYQTQLNRFSKKEVRAALESAILEAFARLV